MENTVSSSCEAERGYLAEFDFFDGDDFVTFNIIGYSTDRSVLCIYNHLILPSFAIPSLINDWFHCMPTI